MLIRKCQVCWENIHPIEMVRLPCKCANTCMGCFKQWVVAHLQRFGVQQPLRCPNDTCGAPVSYGQVYPYITNEAAQRIKRLNSLEHAKRREREEEEKDFREEEGVGDSTSVIRRGIVLRMKSIMRRAKNFWRGINDCPNCGVPIYKDGGCSHIFCTHCLVRFCHHCRAIRKVDEVHVCSKTVISNAISNGTWRVNVWILKTLVCIDHVLHKCIVRNHYLLGVASGILITTNATFSRFIRDAYLDLVAFNQIWSMFLRKTFLAHPEIYYFQVLVAIWYNAYGWRWHRRIRETNATNRGGRNARSIQNREGNRGSAFYWHKLIGGNGKYHLLRALPLLCTLPFCRAGDQYSPLLFNYSTINVLF